MEKRSSKARAKNREKYDQYLEWMMTPPGEREPEFKKDMSELLDVNRSTLYTWENEPDFQERLRELKSKWGLRWHGDILGRLMKIVIEGADSTAIQASKVLLSHLDLAPAEKESQELSPVKVEALSKWLKEHEFAVIDNNE